MKNRLVETATKLAAVLAAPALGLALTAVPAQAASDTNLSGFDQAGIGSAASSTLNGGQQSGFSTQTIGNQKVSPAANAPKDVMPDNPSQKLPDKVSAAVPDDATVVSKNLAVTTDGQVKNVETGKPVTDPKLVGTADQQPDPLAKTDGKRFIPVEANKVKKAVEKNGGDADATNGSNSGSNTNNESNSSSNSSNGSNSADSSSASAKVRGAVDVETNKQTSSVASGVKTGKHTTGGNVRNVALQNNQYGAYWGWYNNTPAFFERGGNLFAQQAKGVVDVSEHQGTIDWQAAKNAGVEGAIIRIAYGWNNRYDYQALRNISECKRLGIPFGIYLYSYAYDNNSAQAEGNDTVNKLRAAGVNPGDLSYPVFYDLEKWSWTGHTPPTNPWVYDGIVKTWWNALLQGGYNNLSVYSYTYYLNTALNTPDVRSNTRWVASYGARTGFGFSSNDRGWQYSDDGWIDGIGNVDHNAFGNLNYVSSAPNIAAYQASSLPNDTYFISSSLRDSAGLDIPGGSNNAGAKIQLYDANQSAAQQYKLTRHGDDGTYEIRNVDSGKVLDIPNGNAYPGAPVQQYDSNDSNAQRWYLRNTGQGGMYIQSKLGNFVLDLPSAQTWNGTRLQLWEPNFTRAQQFLFSTVVDLPSGYVRITSTANGSMVMDVPWGSQADGAHIQTYTSNDTDAQKFTFRQVGNAVYEIINAHSGKAVDLTWGSTNNGTAIQQYSRNNSCSQHWLVRQQGVGRYSFYSGCAADKAIDVPGGWAKNGAALQIYDGNGTAAQKWWLTPVKTSWQYTDDLAAAHRSEISDGVYSFGSKNKSSQVLDVSGGSLGNSARVQLYGRNWTGAQSWRISHDSTGYVTLTNTQSGKVLDVPGGADQAGVGLQQYQSNHTRAQKWIAVRDGNAYKFVSAIDTNLVLDVNGGSTANGAVVQLYYSNDTYAQRWYALQ